MEYQNKKTTKIYLCYFHLVSSDQEIVFVNTSEELVSPSPHVHED